MWLINPLGGLPLQFILICAHAHTMHIKNHTQPSLLSFSHSCMHTHPATTASHLIDPNVSSPCKPCTQNKQVAQFTTDCTCLSLQNLKDVHCFSVCDKWNTVVGIGITDILFGKGSWQNISQLVAGEVRSSWGRVPGFWNDGGSTGLLFRLHRGPFLTLYGSLRHKEGFYIVDHILLCK